MKRPAAAALALLAAACSSEVDRGSYSGTIEFPDVQVGSLVGGRVERVRKREGERAAAGETLVELDPKEWRSALEEAKALADATARELDLLLAGARAEDIAAAEAESKRLELLWQVVAQGARPEEIAAARERVKEADAALVEADAQVERERRLLQGGSASQERVDAALAARDTARARKSAAEQQMQLLEKGFRPQEIEASRQAHVAQEERVRALRAGARPEEIAAKRATLDAARARIALAESKLQELTIHSPADAFVQTLDLRPGDLLAAGAPVAVLLLAEEPWVTIHVPESELASVQVGGEARVTPDGHPPLAGRVAWVSRVAEYTPRNVQTRGERVTQVFAVKVVIHGDATRIKDGMWADVNLR